MDKLAWIIIIAVPVIFAIVFHEVAHGFVAYYYGDPTAKMKGRLSLNPLVHIDPIGTILLPVFLILIKAPVLGWAKPVPVNFNNLRNPRKHMAYVSVAGPATNFALAILSLIAIKIIYTIDPSMFYLGKAAQIQGSENAMAFILKPLARMLPISLMANIGLGLLNLIPILPLDGGRILTAILPPRQAMAYSKIERYGILIILGLLMTGALVPVIRAIFYIIYSMFHLAGLPPEALQTILIDLLNFIDQVVFS